MSEVSVPIGELVAAFRDNHGDHYDVGSPLGAGAHATAFRGFDRRRGIDVCPKFFHGADAPPGEARDWFITSTLKHPSINDTHAVEHYAAGSTMGVAIVSRFQRGRNLGEVLDGISKAADPELLAALQDKLFRGIGQALCRHSPSATTRATATEICTSETSSSHPRIFRS